MVQTTNKTSKYKQYQMNFSVLFFVAMILHAVMSQECGMPNCASCPVGYCEQCSAGYFPTDSNGCRTCGDLIPQCLSCVVSERQTECIQCQPMYAPSKDVCCDFLMTFPDGQGGCIGCPLGCLDCSFQGNFRCQKCDKANGYLPSGDLCCNTNIGRFPAEGNVCKTCQEIIDGCLVCGLDEGETYCKICSSGFYKEGVKYKTCPTMSNNLIRFGNIRHF